jgi:dihydrodipicolinate synthase/N-acetylneuraminate lyase
MKQFRGIYGILTAPYDAGFELDVADIKSQVEFCVKGGAHGIVAPVNASEFFVLSDDERQLFVRVMVEQTAGRVPVIAGVTTQSARASAALARHAKEVGADAVIAAPPTLPGAKTNDELFDYFRQIADASELPVFIQNHTAPLGLPITSEQCMAIIQKVDGVHYVKEETQFSSHLITQINDLGRALPERYKGVMGGKACRYLIDEFNRGACGCMPACEIVDVMAKVWNLLEANQMEEAESLYEKTLQLLNMEFMYGYSIYKEVLRRRGIIKSAATRSTGGYYLDEKDHEELTRVMRPLMPYFTV